MPDLKNGVFSSVQGRYRSVRYIPQRQHPVAVHFRIDIAAAIQKEIHDNGLFHLERVKQIAGFIIQQPQTVIVLDFLGAVGLTGFPIQPDRQTGDTVYKNRFDLAPCEIKTA